MQKQLVFRPGDVELRPAPAQQQAFRVTKLRWMISVNLNVRGGILECEVQAFFQFIEPDNRSFSSTKTFVLLNVNETQPGDRIKAIETQTFDARNGTEANLEPTMIGSGSVDYYRITGISRDVDGQVTVGELVVTVVFRTLSLMLETA